MLTKRIHETWKRDTCDDTYAKFANICKLLYLKCYRQTYCSRSNCVLILHETKLVTLWTQNGSIRQLGKLQGNVFLEKWNPVSVSLKLFLRAKFKRQPNYNLKKKIFKVFYWFRTCFRLNVTKSFFNKKMAFKKCNNVLTKQKLSLKAYLRECYKIGSLKNI